jgi:hypothetical protein
MALKSYFGVGEALVTAGLPGEKPALLAADGATGSRKTSSWTSPLSS